MQRETHPLQPERPPELQAGKGRVLIVEDEVLLCMVLEDALSFEGYAVVGVARSAAEAVELAVAQEPDLVLMDVHLLGGVDGIVAAAQILERTGIRCLMATAYTDEDTRRRAAPVRPLGWLAKPYDQEGMLDAVARALEQTGER
ncbi:MAG: response regulator [Alphaproteobacteria bacterium]|nr:response regulator [Alphaproteobacteria bacterium]MBV8410442.1 response regulator [Alphaproteobacteria bacterium]